MRTDMNPFRILLLIPAIAIGLAGCSTTISKDTRSPFYPVPVGSTLVLKQKIEIPPNRTRVFMQNGVITGIYDHYAPTCNVEVDRLDDHQPQFVAPGAYRIHRVQITIQEVVQTGKVQVAALGDGPGLQLALGGADKPDIYRGYHLWVEDPANNFTRLSCRGGLDEPWQAYPPSIDDMRQALGQIAELRLAGEH